MRRVGLTVCCIALLSAHAGAQSSPHRWSATIGITQLLLPSRYPESFGGGLNATNLELTRDLPLHSLFALRVTARAVLPLEDTPRRAIICPDSGGGCIFVKPPDYLAGASVLLAASLGRSGIRTGVGGGYLVGPRTTPRPDRSRILEADVEFSPPSGRWTSLVLGVRGIIMEHKIARQPYIILPRIGVSF